MLDLCQHFYIMFLKKLGPVGFELMIYRTTYGRSNQLRHADFCKWRVAKVFYVIECVVSCKI